MQPLSCMSVRHFLLGVQLDDEVLLDRQVDILPDGEGHYLGREGVLIEVQPLGGGTGAVGLQIGLKLVKAAACDLCRQARRYHSGIVVMPQI